MQYGGFAPPGGAVHMNSLSVILFTQKSVARIGNPTKLFDKMNPNTTISDSSDFCKNHDYAQQGRRRQEVRFEGYYCPSKA
jgi:hypothetical protein